MDIKDVENYVILSRVYGRVKESAYEAQRIKESKDFLEGKESEYALKDYIAKEIAKKKDGDFSYGFFAWHDDSGQMYRKDCTKEEWLKNSL